MTIFIYKFIYQSIASTEVYFLFLNTPTHTTVSLPLCFWKNGQ